MAPFFIEYVHIKITNTEEYNMAYTWKDFMNECENCQACDLAKTRKNVVVYRGAVEAPLMLIGEGPGANEDEEGLPFVGQAGRLLSLLLDAYDLEAKDYHICNVVKCRPPENRVPTIDEAHACKPLLAKQIRFAKPKVIVLLGKTAYTFFTGDNITPISKVRGQFIEKNGYYIMPTFHPAYILRNNNERVTLWRDIGLVRNKLSELGLVEPLRTLPEMPTERPKKS